MEYAPLASALQRLIEKYRREVPSVTPEHVARTFIWFALSSTLFGRAEGTAMFSLLGSLEDISRIGEYSWGEAGLAETYFALDDYTRLGHTSLYCFEFTLEVCSCFCLSFVAFLF